MLQKMPDMALRRNESELFVWRRAFRSPQRSVVRAEVMEALGISGSAASKLLSEVVALANGLLERQGNKVVAPPWAQAPKDVDEVDLMRSLESGQVAFAQTGLLQEELPVRMSAWSSNLPAEPGALTLIVQACTRKKSVFIRYVGLRKGSLARYRRIFPLAVERMGDQWRLVAHDLEKPLASFPVQSFVLSRITGAHIDPKRLPKTFIAGSPIDFKKEITVRWNLMLTADQIEALGNELGIDEQGKARLNSRDEREFLHRFGGEVLGSDVAWPPLRKS